MNISALFIRRPIGTTLLAIGVFLVGAVAWSLLPVASLPAIDFPAVFINAQYPGASPEIMAETVAAPIERRVGEIAGVTELTSVSSLGSSVIIALFDLSRNGDAAARDVQAALNAAATDLPSGLPNVPTFRKANPNAIPVLILALTSDTLPTTALYDAADTVLAQRISQVDGVAQVSTAGADQPAVRVRADPTKLSDMGLSMDDIRTAIVNANAVSPLGTIDTPALGQSIGSDDQLDTIPDYGKLVIKNNNGTSALVSDVATVDNGVRNMRSMATFNGKPAVLIQITKQADANVIETVDHVKALLPKLQRFLPAGINISVLNDRTETIRASVNDMAGTLLATIVMVMVVVFIFLRRITPTAAAGVTVPLALAGTCAGMYAAHFSIDNISLMALATSVGFVVDDAIVMIENIDKNRELGLSPMQAALAGSRQIGFTVISISVSLMAAFIPLLLLGGMAGRLFREFSVTLAFAIIISTVASLTITPMISAHLTSSKPARPPNFLDRLVEGGLERLTNAYASSLKVVLRHRVLTMVTLLLTIALTVALFIKTPKGLFPADETDLISGSTEAATEISYPAMVALQEKVAGIVQADPAVDRLGSSVGASGQGPNSSSINQGKLYITLKPLAQRGNLSTNKIIDRLRRKLSRVPGMNTFLVAQQDLRFGGRQSKAAFQFTLTDSDFGELTHYTPLVLDQIKKIPGIVDVTTDREANGLQANVVIDRLAASRLGITMANIDNSLNNAFSQRQISTIYSARNQYRVVLEVPNELQREPKALDNIFVPAGVNLAASTNLSGAQVQTALVAPTTAQGATVVPQPTAQIKLSTVAHIETGFAPLTVAHQGQFPAITISYNLRSGAVQQDVNNAIPAVLAKMHLPDTLHGDFAGDAKLFQASAGSQALLLYAALIAVYIVLGVLYESLAHPLTIISTLPSAGLGALLALQWTGTELTLIAFIGIVLLIGIVKKNGIMLVDFALHAERERGMEAVDAIYEACIERFRPILMTTLAALFGAIPLIMSSGAGAGLRHPLGVAIAGGLLVSQLFTLYTTPVIYLYLDKLNDLISKPWGRRRRAAAQPAE
jgi:multidrug efflux pump subunit AcrB